MKKFAFVILIIVAPSCGPQPSKPPPQTVAKKITVKQSENYTENEIDGAAFIFDNKIRSVPVMKTRYRLYAEDGTYLDVDARKYATTKEGDEVEAQEGK